MRKYFLSQWFVFGYSHQNLKETGVMTMLPRLLGTFRSAETRVCF